MKYKNKLGSLLKDNSKCFWKYVKTKRGQKSGISSILSENGDIVHDTKNIANILNKQYRKVFCDESTYVASTSNKLSYK